MRNSKLVSKSLNHYIILLWMDDIGITKTNLSNKEEATTSNELETSIKTIKTGNMKLK